TGPAASDMQRISANSTLAGRLVSGPTYAEYYLALDTARLPLTVRQALNYAVGRESLVGALGGARRAAPSTGLFAGATPAGEGVDVYPAHAIGVAAKATSLLAGDRPKLKLCHRSSTASNALALQLRTAFAGASITINDVTVSASDFFDPKRSHTAD